MTTRPYGARAPRIHDEDAVEEGEGVSLETETRKGRGREPDDVTILKLSDYESGDIVEGRSVADLLGNLMALFAEGVEEAMLQQKIVRCAATSGAIHSEPCDEAHEKGHLTADEVAALLYRSTEELWSVASRMERLEVFFRKSGFRGPAPKEALELPDDVSAEEWARLGEQLAAILPGERKRYFAMASAAIDARVTKLEDVVAACDRTDESWLALANRPDDKADSVRRDLDLALALLGRPPARPQRPNAVIAIEAAKAEAK